MENKTQNNFSSRLKSMLKLDFQRMFKSPLFYIMVGIALVLPILILVMTTMLDGTVNIDLQTGKETVIEGFKNVWEIISTISSDQQSAESLSMGITSMCNINLIYFIVAVFVCIFVADDFRSGYSKNLFTVRADKKDYVISKTIVVFVVGSIMILTFFVGSMIGGAIAGLPFTLEGANAGNVVLCLLSKTFLMLAITPIYLVMAIIAKQKLWLSILLSLASGALLFMMIPMITPLNVTILNVILCLVGGAIFSIGFGIIDKFLLKKRDIL